MNKSILGLAAAALCVVSAPSMAATYVLTYTYVSGSYESSGFGEFSTDAVGAVQLSDVQDFTFQQTLHSGYEDNFYYGLADLSAFSAFVDGTGVTALSLTTGGVGSPDNGSLFPQYLGVNSLAVGDSNINTIYGYQVNTGTLSVEGVPDAVPEPASWAMFIGGFGLVGSAMRRKKVSVSFA